jgi:NRPS condensation-like uncharacterized protein
MEIYQMDKEVASGKLFRAEVFDNLQFLFEEYKYNDHQLHCVITFSGKLNQDLLKKAVYLSMEIVPLLGSRYVVSTRHPYWESLEKTQYEKAVSFIDSPDLDINDHLTSRTSAQEGPQLQVTLLSGPDYDVLCIVMNHMVCDAAGFKDYLYLLGSIYSELVKNPDYIPLSRFKGTRSLSQVFNRLNIVDRVKLLFLSPNSKNSEYRLINQYTGDKVPQPYMQLYKLPQTRYQALKTYCNRQNVTINDVMLAVYYRTLYRLLNINDNIALNIPCTVDLRRYLPDHKTMAICNLASWIVCDIIPGKKEEFDDTVKKVHNLMESRKSSFPGLNGLATLSLAFQLFSYQKAKELIKKKLQYPLFALTNIGTIDRNSLLFHNILVTDAFMTGSIKYPPYFQMALSTFNDTITFSLNLCDSESDRDLIKRYFELFDQELMDNICNSKL